MTFAIRKVPISLAALLLAVSAPSLAMDPSPPGGVRVDVYSSTAAELFWDRSGDDGIVVAYEVRLDDEIVTTLDGLSYFSDGLTAGTPYTYEVIAIDDEGNRSSASSVSFVGGDREPTSGQGPASPDNLRGFVYSSSAIEIVWDRPSSVGLTYDVLRDGELIETTDGISYFDDGLEGGRDYTYAVVAIDPQGGRSDPSDVELSTQGGGTAPPSGDPGGDTGGDLAAPTGLSAAVYSSTAAEISWTRPDAVGLTYEVARDGVSVATTDGISYFDDSLAAGRSYTYAVVAIDRTGTRSPASSIMLNTPGGGGGSVDEPDGGDESPAISEPSDLYVRDGYGRIDVVRLDVRTATSPGVCTVDDESGCTLADVIADIDGDDDFTVDIPVHFQGDDLPDDGSVSNAELRQRGGFSRLAPQKSFRIRLDSDDVLWRNEQRLQLNKMPYDTSRIRNKLSFDLMSEIPHLPSLRTQFVNLWIDDGEGPEDYGLFTHTEYVGNEYLANRERNEDDKSYKIEEFVFSLGDLDFIALDDDGEPLDDDRFETRLDIKTGDDHRKLIEMIRAVNDQSQPFESILARWFDEENVLTWVTVNFLLHQVDAVTHNFYLYNPVDSDTFYFMPWDYDGTFDVEPLPANSFETNELMRRLYYGYSKGRASNFLNRYYRMPGIHERILAKATELRNSALMDSNISEKAARYSAVIAPVAGRSPDLDFNASFSVANSQDFASFVARSHQALIDYGIPLPPKWRDPVVESDEVVFRWQAAHDMNGDAITYDIEVSSSPGFGADDRLVLETGIAESSRGGYAVDRARIGTGTRYARLVARVSSDPARFWQTASNRPDIDGSMRVGVIEFSVP